MVSTGVIVGVVVIVVGLVIGITIAFALSYRNRPSITFPSPLQEFREPVIWTYWEGPKPAIIEMCEESIHYQAKRAGLQVIGVTPHTLTNYVKMPEVYHTLLTPSQRSDVLRCALLYAYGGIWLDMDVIATGDFSIFRKLFQRKKLFAYRIEELANSYSMACLISKARLPATEKWFRAVMKKLVNLHTQPESLKDLGIGVLWKIFKTNPEEVTSLESGKTVEVLYKNKVEDLCVFYRPFQPFIVLFHSKFDKELKKKSREELAKDDSNMCRLLSNYKDFSLACSSSSFVNKSATSGSTVA